MNVSQRISAFTAEADRIFNHILGYVIAFSALIAFADVLGDGKIVQYMPWLFWIWVIAQGLGVEFQVFVLIRRLPRLWTVNRGMFWGNILFILALCIISVLIGSVFVEHDNAGGTIESAMNVLHINHIGFIYARSALAILLVVLIGIDRAMDHEQHESQQEAQKQHALITAFEARLAQLAQAEHEARASLAATVQQELRTVTITMTEQTYVLRQELSTVSSTVEEVANTVEKQTQKLLAMPKTDVSERSKMNRRQGERVHLIQPIHDNKRERVHRVLLNTPDASVSEIEKLANVSRGYASKLRAELLPEVVNRTSEQSS